MVEQNEFRKVRDFSENINDTFLFIRLNFKPLMKSFFGICAAFMLAFAIFSSMYQSKLINIFTQYKTEMFKANSSFANMFDLNYLLMTVFALLTFVSMKVAYTAYVKCSMASENQAPGIEAVWAVFRHYFFKVLVYFLLLWLIIVVCAAFAVALIAAVFYASIASGILLVMLFMVAMVYVLTVFTPFETIVILEDTGFGGAFTRCFALIKDNFWMSFGIYFIGYLIYAIAGGIVSALTAGIIGTASYLTTKNVGSSIHAAASVLNIFSYTFFIIFLVSSTLQYFSLVEKKDGTGILRRIDTIGTDKTGTDHPEEQY